MNEIKKLLEEILKELDKTNKNQKQLIKLLKEAEKREIILDKWRRELVKNW